MTKCRPFIHVVLWLVVSTFAQQKVSIVLLHRRGNGTEASSQREMAAQWAAEVITNQTQPHLFSIELKVLDTCGSVEVTAKKALQIVRDSKVSAVLGVIALEEPNVLEEAARVLRRHHMPLIIATPKATEVYSDDLVTQPDNVFSAVPNTAAVARATMAVAKGMQSSSVKILGTNWRTIRMAEKAARHLGIRVVSAENYVTDYSSSPYAFLNGLAETDQDVALLMEPDELTLFMNRAVKMNKKITYLMGCVAGAIHPQTAAQWALDLTSSSFLIEPHLLELAGLADYLQTKGVAHHPIDNEIPHIVQAVSALGAAFHLQELATCIQQNDSLFDCNLMANPAQVPGQMLISLRQLSLPNKELEGMSNHFTPSGRLVANRYLIQKLMAGSGESSPVAWYSDDDGLVLAAVMTSQSRFDFFGHSSSGPMLSSVSPFYIDDSAPSGDATAEPSSEIITASPSLRPLFVQGRTWAASILAISATEFMAAVYILMILLSRICEGTIRRKSQTMMLLLLMTVMAQLVSVVMFVFPALDYLKLFVPPMLLVLSYAILLTRLIQFRHMVSAGLGGSVPQCPLYLFVLLAVAVQAAVSAHFYLDIMATLPLLYLYLMLLVAVTALYASALKTVRQQHREAHYILIATIASSGVLAVWACAIVVSNEELDDALTAGLLVLLSATVMGAMFVPRVIKLTRQRRQLTTKSTYHCNVSMTTPSPWMNVKPSGAQSNNYILSGTGLMRHPAYTGR